VNHFSGDLAKAIIFVLCLSFAAGPEVRAEPAVRAPDLSPKQAYLRMVSEMRTFRAPAFVEYDDNASFLTNSKAQIRIFHTVYRQRDGMAKVQRLSNGTPDGRPRTYVISVAPTIVMKGSADAAPAETPAGSLRVIASVDAIPERYTISFGSADAVSGCQSPFHLLLQPLTDPERNNLRELWIDSTNYRICRAVLSVHMTYYFAHPPGRLLIDVAPNGYVYHSVMTATAHIAFMSTNLTEEDTFSNITPLNSTSVDQFGGM
jgi:hypothetical protein